MRWLLTLPPTGEKVHVYESYNQEHRYIGKELYFIRLEDAGKFPRQHLAWLWSKYKHRPVPTRRLI